MIRIQLNISSAKYVTFHVNVAIANMGSSALASHEKGTKHLKNMGSYRKQNLVLNCLNMETVPTGPDVPQEPAPTSDYTPEPATQEARVSLLDLLH